MFNTLKLTFIEKCRKPFEAFGGTASSFFPLGVGRLLLPVLGSILALFPVVDGVFGVPAISANR